MKNRHITENFKLYIFNIFLLLISVVFYIFSYKNLLKIVYPHKYSIIIKKAAHEFNIPQEMIFAIIKTESGFNPDAMSNAGAIGLMQVTAETFHWLKTSSNTREILQKLKIDENLYNPYTNIICGTCFLWILNKKFDNETNVLAAYNAGIYTVSKWLNNKKFSKDGKNLNFVPYYETRNYIQKVLNAKKIYEKH